MVQYLAVGKGQPYKNRMTKASANQLIGAEDRAALPFLNKKCKDKTSPNFGMRQEDCLVQHIIERLRLADVERRMRVERMQYIDVQMSGVVKHDKDDRKRDNKNKRGHDPKPVKISLPLTYSQINDMVTYCMDLYAPDTDIFIATSNANKQDLADGLTQAIGKQGQTLQYYRHVCRFVLNALKYNFGVLSCTWEKQDGIVFAAPTNSTSGQSIPGQLQKQAGTMWEGNVVKCCDSYNFLFDTSVHPVDLPLRGEYFAEVEALTPFRVQRMREQKILFGIERYINEYAPLANTNSGTFYIQPPVVREPVEYTLSTLGMVNWQQILAPGGPARESQLSLEIVWFTSWVVPAKFDLSPSTSMELWRIALANGRYITAAYPIEDAHGQLPCGVATPVEDDLRNDQRTYAEMLLPLQQFASFLINTHVDATRKAIYGITVYDASLFPGMDLSTEDLIGARVPMKSSATGVDIDKAFRTYNDAPETDHNVEMVGKIVELMQKILPTNQAQQVADLERATEYQAAATVQASSRTNLKIARLINDQALSKIKFQMMYNIYAKMTEITYVDSQGKQQTIQPAQLLEAEIEFDVGTGLRGLDRLQQVGIFKDLMVYLFQVKGITSEVDVLALLSYVTEIAGFKSNLNQFRIAPSGTANQSPDQINQNQQQQQQPNGGQGGAAPAQSPNGNNVTPIQPRATA